uniref:Uncharacterized protein n=1 Tax=Anguilla anguilla TaxID=7936 RepID=A0A0E9WLU4_ANGAN
MSKDSFCSREGMGKYKSWCPKMGAVLKRTLLDWIYSGSSLRLGVSVAFFCFPAQ